MRGDDSLSHPAGFVTTIGGGTAFVPGFTGAGSRLSTCGSAFRVAEPAPLRRRSATLWQNTSYGYPQQSGLGFGG